MISIFKITHSKQKHYCSHCSFDIESVDVKKMNFFPLEKYNMIPGIRILYSQRFLHNRNVTKNNK